MNPNKKAPFFNPIDPILPGSPSPACPILLEAKSALENANDLHKALRHLSRSSRRCLTCPENSACPSIRYFNHAIDLAVQHLTRQWGLDQD
jgi:hypothetical protein